MSLRVEHVLLAETAQAVAASQTKQIVSRMFLLTGAGMSRGFRVDVSCSSVTSAAGITAILQSSPDGETWADVDATNIKAAITTDGWVGISANAADSTVATKFPVQPRCRVVVTTGAGDAATVDDIIVSQPA